MKFSMKFLYSDKDYLNTQAIRRNKISTRIWFKSRTIEFDDILPCQ